MSFNQSPAVSLVGRQALHHSEERISAMAMDLEGYTNEAGLPVTMDPWDRLILIYHPVVFRRTSDVLQDNFLNHQGAVSYSLVAWPTTPAWPSASLSAHTWPVAFSTAQAWQAKSRSGRGTDAIRMVRLSIAGPNGVVSNMFKKWCHSL